VDNLEIKSTAYENTGLTNRAALINEFYIVATPFPDRPLSAIECKSDKIAVDRAFPTCHSSLNLILLYVELIVILASCFLKQPATHNLQSTFFATIARLTRSIQFLRCSSALRIVSGFLFYIVSVEISTCDSDLTDI
jgi:hypothetical protein